MPALLALLLSLLPVSPAWGSSDTCVDHCHLEGDPDGAYKVLCICSEKPYPGAGSFFALRRSKPDRFQTELANRLRGANKAEEGLVAEDSCAGRDDSPLCRCVKNRTALQLDKFCGSTGAGERICQYKTKGTALSQRAPFLVDYQACIATRLNYRHDSCVDNTCSHFDAAYDGGGDVRKWRVTLSPEFNDHERAAVEAAVASIPACWRKALEGIRINKVRLFRIDVHQTTAVTLRTADGRKLPAVAKVTYFACEAGRVIKKKPDSIDLDPACGITAGIAVHELFHVLDRRGGLGLAWNGPVEGRPACPVSNYGAHNVHEDLAEAGRLLIYPDDGGISEPRREEGCVDQKLARLRTILAECK